ncbi:hypothetical protein I3W98_34955, partial [Streptomyces cavourensis]|nr:hypothetical protein [Streptomyces cavourensis]
QHVKPGKGPAFVRTKLKNARGPGSGVRSRECVGVLRRWDESCPTPPHASAHPCRSPYTSSASRSSPSAPVSSCCRACCHRSRTT